MKQPAKILLVDDDEEDRLIIHEGFVVEGVAEWIHYEENGESALNWLEERFPSELPCLIILDLNMPRMNGTQTLRAIKSDKRFRNIKTVIYSTSLNEIEKEACMLLGAEGYIIKPLTYQESLMKANQFKKFCNLTTP